MENIDKLFIYFLIQTFVAAGIMTIFKVIGVAPENLDMNMIFAIAVGTGVFWSVKYHLGQNGK